MTTHRITPDTFGLFEAGIHQFGIEASTFGLKVGEAPRSIETTLGNGQPFLQHGYGEGVIYYRQAFGCLRLHLLLD